MKTEEAFWARVDKNGPEVIPGSPCWIWTGAQYSSGHGCLGWNERVVSAHRLAYEFQKGPIPEGLHVLHACDVRTCVRGEHLSVGTNKENVDDKMRKGRHRVMAGDEHWTHRHPERVRGRPRKEKQPAAPKPKGANSNLTDAHARDIVRRVADGESAYAVGVSYKLTLSTVYRICHGALRAKATDPALREKASAQIKAGHLKGRRPRLTQQQVDRMRELSAQGARQWQIAQELGISQAMVSKALNGKFQAYKSST